MRGSKFVIVFLTAMLIGISACCPAFCSKRINVVFISGTTEKNLFWKNYLGYMRVACNKLGMNFKVYYANENYIKLTSILKSSLYSKNKPDVVVFQDIKNQAESMFKISEQAKVPIFLANTALTRSEAAQIGKPRQKYKYWIGQMIPDDKEAGYLVAKTLFNQLPHNGKKYHVLALKGDKVAECSNLRVEGLKKALTENHDMVLDQIIPAFWLTSQANYKFIILKKTRYPNVKVVWTAGDAMAIGVMNGTKKLKLNPGRDILTGGVDWLPSALNEVKKKEINVSVGGHFVEGGWIAVLLYDYFHGHDFAAEKVCWETEMIPITSKNVDYYREKLAEKNWSRINFKKFSKSYNHKVKRYNFTIKNLLN